MGDWDGEKDWYGGRIQQRGHVVEENGQFSIILRPAELGYRSRMLLRFFGSRRFLQISLKKINMFQEGAIARLRTFFRQKHVLLGRVFMALHAKDDSVWLVETEEDYQRGPSRAEGDHYRISFEETVNWFNPFDANGNQVGHYCIR